MLHEGFAANTLAQLFFDYCHFWAFTNVLEYTYEFTTCLDALYLLRLPNSYAKLELNLLEVADFMLSEVLFGLSKELNEDNVRKSVMLCAHPVHMIEENLGESFVYYEL